MLWRFRQKLVFVLFISRYFTRIINCILVWCIEWCCVCHQGQICKKDNSCLNLYPCVIKYYLISGIRLRSLLLSQNWKPVSSLLHTDLSVSSQCTNPLPLALVFVLCVCGGGGGGGEWGEEWGGGGGGWNERILMSLSSLWALTSRGALNVLLIEFPGDCSVVHSSCQGQWIYNGLLFSRYLPPPPPHLPSPIP